MGATASAETTTRVVSAKMDIDDIPEVIALLREAPETAFCEWEDDLLLSGHLAVSDGLCRVAREGGRLVGALIAGSYGVRGTISHIAVDRGYRRAGVARLLVDEALREFRGRGIHRVFLFVLEDNDAASGLWATAGFRPTTGERTLECDL